MIFSAVVLAGGRSSRMGRDKALLEIGGRSLLARQIETARAAGAEEVFISGRSDADYGAFGLPVLHDERAGCGPISGVIAALRRATHPHLLVLAVDLPLMRAGFLKGLLQDCAPGRGAVPCLGGHYEPLAAIYPQAFRPPAEAAYRIGECSLQGLISKAIQRSLLVAREVAPGDEGCFLNLNSPASASTHLRN